MANQPWLWIIGGPNGCGKTTLVKHLKRSGILGVADDAEWFNPDASALSVRAENPDLDELGVNALAILRTDFAVDHCVEQGRSCVVETVLTHEKHPARFNRAKKLGFSVGLIYVIVPNVNLAVARVRTRVQMKGHDVPEATIRSRWGRSLDALSWFAHRVDALHVYLNLDVPRKVAGLNADGVITWTNECPDEIVSRLEAVLDDPLGTKRPLARALSRPLAVRPTEPFTGSEILTGPIKVQGKFFFAGREKFVLRGVTYGPFAVGSHGFPFPERLTVERDFSLMESLGANCIRTFTVPPIWLLDIAATHGLRVMIGLPWSQHVCFLDSAALQAEIRRSIADGVRAGQRHPAIFGYLVGNEIPPDIVRWHGPEDVQRFLGGLVQAAKDVHPETLVSYANFPSTEYLDTDFADFLSFNVYLHREESFRQYIWRLHNLAANRPLVLTEFGMDSIREGRDTQAQTLSWQVRAALEMGVAGTVIFSWTDEWFIGGYDVQDWAFGLVDGGRVPKPAYDAVQQHYLGELPPPLASYPRVTVVICAFNAASTIEACLTSLEKLNYPDYEVVVVNDGSTDATREITERYPWARLINQENKGLSVARNVGIAAATGEIVAFTDSDCVPDPDWLFYLVAKLQSSSWSVVGGPNLPPAEESLVPSCVAASPGGPTHILLSDEVAEQIAGCNMAFRREVLEEVGGFDPLFRAAGDDVDMCWRLQNMGYTIGFSPAAVVWHFRRNTVRDYVKQQRGYGKAEVLLYFKHPYRFTMLGQPKWLGRILQSLARHVTHGGDLSSLFLARRPMIYSGVFGRGFFQTLYEPPASLFSYLPLSLEWTLTAVFLLLGAVVLGDYLWIGALPLLISWVCCVRRALRTRIDPRFETWRARALVAFLIYIGPLARSLERYRWRIRGLTEVDPIEFTKPVQTPRLSWDASAFELAYWSDDGLEKESILQGLIDFLLPRKYFVAFDQGWSEWDLQVYRGILSKAQIKVGTENHGGNKRLHRVRCTLRIPRPAMISLCFYPLVAVLALILRLPEAAATIGILGVVNAVALIYQGIHLGRILYQVVEIVGQRLSLTPLRPR